MNVLYCGDNLDILREHIDGETVDLVYLDPPFNSSRSYNVLFRDESGKEADLLNGVEVKMPPTSVTFKQAGKVKVGGEGKQGEMF